MRDTQHLPASHPVNFTWVWLRIHDYFLRETSSQVAPGLRSVRPATRFPPCQEGLWTDGSGHTGDQKRCNLPVNQE